MGMRVYGELHSNYVKGISFFSFLDTTPTVRASPSRRQESFVRRSLAHAFENTTQSSGI